MEEVATAGETAAAAAAGRKEVAPVVAVAVTGVARKAGEGAGETMGAVAERLVGCRGAAALAAPLTSNRCQADPWHTQMGTS